jgi:hypothetical protein
VLTKEQIIDLLKENPGWRPDVDASEEEMAWYEEAMLELGLDDDDLEDKGDLDEDDEDLDKDDDDDWDDDSGWDDDDDEEL